MFIYLAGNDTSYTDVIIEKIKEKGGDYKVSELFEIDINRFSNLWGVRDYYEALDDQKVIEMSAQNLGCIHFCDVFVLVLPAKPQRIAELGYAKALQKKCVVVLELGVLNELNLIYKNCILVNNIKDLINVCFADSNKDGKVQ